LAFLVSLKTSRIARERYEGGPRETNEFF